MREETLTRMRRLMNERVHGSEWKALMADPAPQRQNE